MDQLIADRIMLIYFGEQIEVGSVNDVFEPPYHPNIESLLSSIPRPDPSLGDDERMSLEGTVPSGFDGGKRSCPGGLAAGRYEGVSGGQDGRNR